MYRNKGLLLLGVSLLFNTAAVYADPQVKPFLDNIFKSHTLIVDPSVSDWKEGQVYRFQETLDRAVQVRGHRAVGYKLALTGKRRAFSAPEPVYSRLYDFNIMSMGGTISLQQFKRPLMELELAFKFTSSFMPPYTLESLKRSVGYVAPAVELPDLVFDRPDQLSWQNFAMSGAGIRQVMIGKPKRLSEVELSDIHVEARWNDQPYSKGYSSNVMSGQWQALLFLAKKLKDRGFHIKSGDWVLTGAMNKMLPLRVGSYRVKYDQLGELSFLVHNDPLPDKGRTKSVFYIDGKPVSEIE